VQPGAGKHGIFHFTWVLKLVQICTLHVHPLVNELSIVISLSQCPPILPRKSFMVRNGGPKWPEVCFLSSFMQRRGEMAYPVPTKGFL